MDELKKGMHITSFDYMANLIGEYLPGPHLKTLEIRSCPLDNRLPARLVRVLSAMFLVEVLLLVSILCLHL